jgi:hypothetical protein
LDGQATAQLVAIKKLSRLVRSEAASTDVRTKARKILNAATANYTAMWSTIWSYESSIKSCTNTTLCVTVDLTPSANSFKAGSKKMIGFANQLAGLLKAVGSRYTGKKGIKTVKAEDSDIIQSISQIPLTASNCSVPKA